MSVVDIVRVGIGRSVGVGIAVGVACTLSMIDETVELVPSRRNINPINTTIVMTISRG